MAITANSCESFMIFALNLNFKPINIEVEAIFSQNRLTCSCDGLTGFDTTISILNY